MIYPNPVKEELLVMSNKSLVNTIEVTDVLGRICISIKNHTSEIIHVEQLPSGIYFIKATDTKGHVLKAKFVKE